MPIDIFAHGIPISSLTGRARELGRELDRSRTIPRDDSRHFHSGHVEKDEALAALHAIDNWSDPGDQAILKKLANVLGVTLEPKKKEWTERTAPDEEWTSVLLDAVPVGQYIFVSDRRKGVIRYDTVSDVWSQLPRPWDEHHRWQSPAIAELDGKLAIVGTYPRQDGPAWGVAHLYDPETGAFSPMRGFSHRANAAAAGCGGKLYVFGGSKFSNEQSLGHGTPVADAQVYDPATGQVSSLPPLPEARYGAKAVTLGDKIYVIGGRGLTPGAARRVDVFDPATGQWQEPYQLASPRTYPTAWVANDKIYVSSGGNYRPVKLDERGITGIMAMTEHGKDIDASTEVLDPAAEGRGTRQGVPLPIDGKQAGVAAMVGDSLYAVALQKTGGGMGRGPSTQVLTEIEEPAPTTVVNITNNVDNSVTIVNDIDVILTSITEKTEVNVVEVTNTHVEINNEITNQVYDIDVLNYQSLSDNRIAVDIDANFFCRPSWNGQPLMSVGRDDDGQRYLFGVPRDGRSALPKDAELWLCHPASGRTVPLQTDAEGRFAAALPEEVGGNAYIVRVDAQGYGVGAEIELP